MKSKIALVCLISVTLVGCGKTTNNPDLIVNPVPPIEAPVTKPLELKEVKIKAYNSEQLAKLAEENKNNSDFVLFGLDLDNLKNLGSNLVEIESYVEVQNQVIGFLKSASAVNQSTEEEKNKK